jgi:membrane protein required for colicin V production
VTDWLSALGWVDGTLLAVLLLSMVVGLVRGFVFECLSLAGWLVAWFGAQWASPQLAPYLPVGSPGSGLNLGAAFIVAFIAALVVWSLLARLIRMLIHATPLSLPDRLLGAGFGLLRGGVLLLAVASAVLLTPAAQSQGWRASHGARWLGLTLQALKPLLPEPAARLLPA